MTNYPKVGSIVTIKAVNAQLLEALKRAANYAEHHGGCTHWARRPCTCYIAIIKRAIKAATEMEESDANARLIAAAPQLLEALASLLSQMDTVLAEADSYQALRRTLRGDPLHVVYNQANAAIKAAKEG